MEKYPVCTRVPKGLWVLFKAQCKARGIRVETGVEQAIIAGLEKLGVEVPSFWVEKDRPPSGSTQGLAKV